MLSSAAREPGVQGGTGPQEYPRSRLAIKNSCSGGDRHGGSKGKRPLEPWFSHLSMGLVTVASSQEYCEDRRRQCE